MLTREVVPGEWSSFFDQFSRLHHGKRVNVQTMGGELGVQANAVSLPLMGVVAEPRDDGGRSISVMAGESPDAHVTHAIARPSKVRIAEWNDGESAALQIEAEGGWTTLVQVGPAAEVLPTGFVTDGTMASESRAPN
jgi:hypothetical protein